MLLVFFPMDRTLQICLCPKPCASVPLCLRRIQFKSWTFFFHCASMQKVSLTAHVECSHLASFVEQTLLCIISVAGWKLEHGPASEKAFTNGFHMQE